MNRRVGIMFAVGTIFVVIFCGGFLYLLRNSFAQAKKIINAGGAFVKEAILDVGATWKVETLRKYADPEILEGSNLDKTQKFLDLYSHKLGKLQNLGLLSLSQADRNPGRDKTKGFAFEYFGDAKFAKDEGRIVVVVINNKGVWKVVGITVFSKALGNEKNAPSATPPPFSK